MIIDSSASLVITSQTHTSAAVTVKLGIQPDRSYEKGDPKGRPRPGREQLYHKHSVWVISREEGEPGSNSGFEGLAAALEGKEHVLEELRHDYAMRIWWNGFSDSGQPGFDFTAEALRRIAELGCDVAGSAALQLGSEHAPLIDRVVFTSPLEAEALERHHREFFADVNGADEFESSSMLRDVNDATRHELVVRWWWDFSGETSAAVTSFIESVNATVVSRTRSVEVARTQSNGQKF